MTVVWQDSGAKIMLRAIPIEKPTFKHVFNFAILLHIHNILYLMITLIKSIQNIT